MLANMNVIEPIIESVIQPVIASAGGNDEPLIPVPENVLTTDAGEPLITDDGEYITDNTVI